MKWYKLYLEAQIRGVISTAYDYKGPMRLRALTVLALARRDAAANLLRSREEFYAELRRLSSHSIRVTIRDVGTNPIRVASCSRRDGGVDTMSALDAYHQQVARLQTLGLKIYEKPYDINGVLVKNGDRVRSTVGYHEKIVEGVATLSDDAKLRNCIIVDGWTSAAFLWEVITS